MRTVYLVASGDLRLSANQNCQPAQEEMEAKLRSAFQREGVKIKRAHEIDPEKGHGFIDSQAYGIEVFRNIPKDAPLVVAEAVWQYSHHVLAGLVTHRGPILTVANWSGRWPGLVGLLNLNASLTKAGVEYSTLWSEEFTDAFFNAGLKSWLKKGKVRQDTTHTKKFADVKISASDVRTGVKFAKEFRDRKAIMGVFDEGCMGMFNAIIPEELLHPVGVFKERLSQSTLYGRMRSVQDEEAKACFAWLIKKGLTFKFGRDGSQDLTERQVIEQLKMYIAAMRIADEFGCDTIGIQYQQGLKDLVAASDLAEGLMNNVDRPKVLNESGKELFRGEALPHFNEVDECAGLDGLITYRLWREFGWPPENTLHDLRWGRQYQDSRRDEFVWVLEISGAAPPEHFIGGYKGTLSERQPPMYFRLGGGTVKGISKPGWIVWSRVFIERGRLQYDTGIGEVLALPQEETADRWQNTTPQWPIMHAVFPGITRDQMMARHKSNHIQVVYAPDKRSALQGMRIKAAAMNELGLGVTFCGEM